MRDFSKISPAIWQSNRFKNLPSDDGRYLHLYFLTSRHQTSAGCYQLPDGYACTDLRWTPKRYATARNELIDAGLICFDPESSVLMITGWFKHNPPMNPSHSQGIASLLDALPSDEICNAALEALRESQDSIEAKRHPSSARPQTRPSNVFGIFIQHSN